MKILHLPSTFFPKHTGGKEVFIYQLIKGTPTLDHLVVYHGDEPHQSVLYDGIQVKILPKPVTEDTYGSYWSLLYDDLPGFGETLDQYQPDLVHFHDFCAGASLSHLRLCKARAIRTIVTYHSPGNSCMQKGLIRANKTPCDGEILDRRCTACRYRVKGVPEPLASMLASTKLPVKKAGRFWLRNSTAAFHQSFREFFDTVDAIQVHARWVRDLLLLNRVNPTKINFVQLGGHPSIALPQPKHRDTTGPLKIAFIGRCVNIKGAHILVEAIRQLPSDTKVEVHFLGPYWGQSAYGRRLNKLTANDKRFLPPRLVSPEHVIDELKTMDICVIPSLWPETGPFSVLDAFAARVPVIGTNHAGIKERVVHGQNGLLFKWGDSEDLAQHILYVLNNREVLHQYKRAISSNYTFSEMASAIKSLYSRIII